MAEKVIEKKMPQSNGEYKSGECQTKGGCISCECMWSRGAMLPDHRSLIWFTLSYISHVISLCARMRVQCSYTITALFHSSFFFSFYLNVSLQ